MKFALQTTTKLNAALFALLLLVSLLATSFITNQSVSAAYNGERLIDNSIFLDANSMSANQIQSFLQGKGSGLANKQYKLQCYGAGSKERQWYTNAGATCDTLIPASHVIYWASQVYGVSPRVTLATLQKEQSLITTQNPTSWQLNQAMGYACPTSGSCGGNSTFSYQIDSGVWALRYHYERANRNYDWWSPSSNNYWVCGSEKNFYKPSLYPGQTVRFYDGNNVNYRNHYLRSAATSALYCYTPHAYNNPQGLYGLPTYGSKGQYYTGSYNFVYWFENWFGSTQATYSGEILYTKYYSDEAKTDELSAPLTLRSDVKVYVEVSVKNNGGKTWKQSFTRLGTVNPHNRYSEFSDNTWLSGGRPAQLKQSSVSPGGIGTFEFTLTTPKVDGFYNERFMMVADGIAWFDTSTKITIPITVQNPYNGQVVDYDSYTDATYTTKSLERSSVEPTQTTYWQAKVKNIGSNTWSRSITRVATVDPHGRSSDIDNEAWITPTRPAQLKEATVAPGQTGTFEFSTTAPVNEGIYEEPFGLVVEGVSWMILPKFSNNYRVSDQLDRLTRGDRLVVGTQLLSGGYRLVMQGDGNLVVYNPGGRPLWSSGTKGGNRFIMQGDGNLVMYNSSNKAIWSSGTN